MARSYFDEHRYRDFLAKHDFNEEQIDFLFDQRTSYEELKRSTEIEECPTCGNKKEVSTFDHDSYEREMWFTMNRSGLFEDDEENKSGITSWGPQHTRQFITEV